MALVEARILINGVREDVYNLAKNMERFPEFMPDVEEVKVLERAGDRTVTEWTTSVEGIPICWTEEDIFDDGGCAISYRLLEGDLDRFEGAWTFQAKDGGTEVVLTVDFDFGMPTLADLLGPILEVKVRENSEMMLSGMKTEIEGLS
jgi:coenzyme Q-binding protein COQ10